MISDIALPSGQIQLVEQHRIWPTDPRFEEAVRLCWLSKNVCNSALFAVRRNIVQTGHEPSGFDLIKQFAAQNQPDFRALPAKVAVQSILLLDWVMRSYRAKQSAGLKARLPGYWPRGDEGLAPVTYTNQALSKTAYAQQGEVALSQTQIRFRPKHELSFEQLNQVRLIPSSKHKSKLRYVTLELVYTQALQPIENPPWEHKVWKESFLKKDGGTGTRKTESLKLDFTQIQPAGLDVNLDHLAVALPTGKGWLFDLKPAKAYNSWHNKRYDALQSTRDTLRKQIKALKGWENVLTPQSFKEAQEILEKSLQRTEERMEKLSNKRSNWMKNFGHQMTTQLANHLKSLNLNLLVIGKLVKQDANMGKKMNRRFVQIPMMRWLEQLQYKLQMRGIASLKVEESYTSKTDFLAGETLFSLSQKDLKQPKGYSFSGKRVTRGLFRSSVGRCIHADINGCLNILRKVVEQFVPGPLGPPGPAWNKLPPRVSCPVRIRTQLH